MKKFKKALAMVIAMLICLSCLTLAGCGDNTPTKQKNDAQVDANDPYAGIEEYEGTTIKFATWIDHTKSEAARVFASFEEKYGIKVELVTVNQKEYVTKVAGLIASKASPDIVVNNGKTPSVYSLLQPLDGVNSVNLKDDFWDTTVLELNKQNGNYYLLNSDYSPQNYRAVVTYNKKIFEDNGFKTPAEFYEEGNWTIDTMEECATRVARLGSDYVGLSAKPAELAQIFGTNLIEYKDGKYVNNSNNEDLKKVYKWALSAQEKGIYTYKNMWWKFNQNLVGMEIYDDWILRANGAYAQYGVDPDTVGYVPLPKLSKDSEQICTIANRSYGICKGSKNAEAAGYFLRYFLDYENYDEKEMFHSDEATEMFKALRKLDCKTTVLIEHSCLASYYGEQSDYPCYDKILNGGSAQFNVNLKKFSSEIQNVVDSCNDILESLE